MENVIIKTIGVLTSGGDAPGMNAAVRSVVRTGLYYGVKMKAIYRGFSGLLNSDMADMDMRSVSGILGSGGTMLYSARCPEFKKPENVKKAVENCKKMGIDGIVVIGGDGSFRGARDLSLAGLPCIGVPATIDNDIASTEYSIGFDTAVNTIIDIVDRLRDTSQSHNRCSVVEVMGRFCGDLALHAAISTGADAMIIPEIPFTIENDIIKPVKASLEHGKSHFIVITAEGVNATDQNKDGSLNANNLARLIEKETGVESRGTIMGHVQRGGRPTGRDRVLAAELGNHAVNLLIQGTGNRVVASCANKIVDYDILEALDMKKEINKALYKVAKEISLEVVNGKKLTVVK